MEVTVFKKNFALAGGDLWQYVYLPHKSVAILLCSEIGRQHIKAAISLYFDLTHPPNPHMNIKDR